MRVYFDASVVIAALLSSTGGSAYLFKFTKKGTIIGITSETVLEEVLEEDKYKKLKKSQVEIERFIFESGLIVRKNITFNEIAPYKEDVDEEDAHLIAGAKLTKCSYLVTLDKKHLLNSSIRENFLPLHIVSPKDLLEKLV